MKKSKFSFLFLILVIVTGNPQTAITIPLRFLWANNTSSSVTIICPAESPSNVKLAAREVRRYLYLRTSKFLPIAESAADNTISFRIDNSLEKQQYHLKSDGREVHLHSRLLRLNPPKTSCHR